MARRHFKVRQRSLLDIKHARELQKKIEKRRSASCRSERRYYEFCHVNVMEPWTSRSILAFVGSVDAQLSAGSTKNVVSDLMKIERRMWGREAAATLLDLMPIVSLNHAAEKRLQQSTDFESLSEAVRLLRRVPSEVRLPLTAMLCFGLRFADLTRLAVEDIRLDGLAAGDRSATLDLYVTKNRRVTGLRYRISLDHQDLEFLPNNMWAELVEACAPAGGRPSVRPFAAFKYEGVNDAVKIACMEARIRMHHDQASPRALATVGSLRRMFVHRVIARATLRNNGELYVCWDAVIRKTGHRNSATVQAYYLPSLSLEVARRG